MAAGAEAGGGIVPGEADWDVRACGERVPGIVARILAVFPPQVAEPPDGRWHAGAGECRRGPGSPRPAREPAAADHAREGAGDAR